MQINPDAKLQAEAIEALRTEYSMGVPRTGVHQSVLSHCLTRSYYDTTDPEPITDKQAVMFGIGFAMERVIFDRDHETALVVDGITLSLDDITKFGGGVDLKTTRMAANGRKGEDGFQFPETWKRQMASYVYGLNRIAVEKGEPETFSFGVIVFHLITADVRAYRITYERWELDENWAWLLTRYDQYASMLAGRNPMPFQWNEDYECRDCSYQLRCGLTASLEELSNA